MLPFVVVVTSPTCANSALLLMELTLISLIDSAEGNISVSSPLERTLMVEMPSTDAVAMKGMDPESENSPPALLGCTPGAVEMAKNTEFVIPARKFTGRFWICSED